MSKHISTFERREALRKYTFKRHTSSIEEVLVKSEAAEAPAPCQNLSGLRLMQ